jgi:uncharacterized protein YjiK
MACKHSAYSSPQGYDLGKPKQKELGKVLNEISGIFYNTSNNTLLAVSDSKRKVFEIDPNRHKLRDFAENFFEPEDQPDYEDVVMVGDQVYALVSDGTIISVPSGAKDTSATEVFPFWSTDKNDFETIYYDPSLKGLVMVCKTCEFDQGKAVRSAFLFNLERKSFDSTALFALSTEKVKNLLKKNDADFKPSAAAIHPINKRLYMLASAGNLLVVCDTRGEVIEAYNLNPDQHPQAEGIAFSPNGDMFIANEGKYGKPTIQVFPYTQGKK